MKLNKNLFKVIVDLFKYEFGHFHDIIDEIYFYHFGCVSYFQMFVLYSEHDWIPQRIMRYSISISKGRIEVKQNGESRKTKEELLSKYSKLESGETFFKYEEE